MKSLVRLTLAVLVVGFALSSGCSNQRTDSRAQSVVVADDVNSSQGGGPIASIERSLGARFPSTGGYSAVGTLLERASSLNHCMPKDGLRCLNPSDRVQLLRALRGDSEGRRARILFRGNDDRRPTSESQSFALNELAEIASGALEVTWNGAKGSPATLSNLHFEIGGGSPHEVWSAFLHEHYGKLARIWNFQSPADLTLTGESGLGEEAVVLHGERALHGLPVDGEFIEAFVTTDGSRLGAGVLFRLNIVADVASRPFPSISRDLWLNEAGARAVASSRLLTDRSHLTDRSRPAPVDASTNPRSVQLRLSCGVSCVPYWSVRYADGWTIRIDATNGDVMSSHRELGNIGPLFIQGRPPGSTSAQAIRFRGANVVDTSTGISLGQTSSVDGTHSISSTTPVLIGLEGPVGTSNPARYGRVERQTFDGSAWISVPLRRAWTPYSEPSRNFGTPDAWAPNSDSTTQFPHSSELLFGWFSYWQRMLASDVYAETTERLVFVLDPDNNSSAGISCNTTRGGNFSSPAEDPNGSATWSTINCSAGVTRDDINSNFVNDGDSIWSAAHEYGHTVNYCANQSGVGCQTDNPASIPIGSRPPSISDWRIAIYGGQTEVGATAISNILTRFNYDNSSPGVPYDANWTYVSYDSSNDSFGTASQSAPSQLNCPDTYTCPTSFLCVATDQNYYRLPDTGGLCAKSCTSDIDCPSGLFCYTQPLRPGGTSKVCWYNSYLNKFWDTVSDRLAYSVGWRSDLSLLLYATGGESNNPTRDLVLGADSFYDRYLSLPSTRFEATRVVRSVYRGSGFVAGDDFPDSDLRASAIPVRSTMWTPIWWGNGLYEYPYFEGYNDADTVIFRGVAGSVYRAESWFMDTSGSPIMQISPLGDPGSGWNSYTGTLTTGPLPSTGWYMAYFWGATDATRWQGRIRLENGSDDIPSSIDEALPMAHSFSATASTTSGDRDAFQIFVPSAGTSLEINVSGLSSGTIYLYNPSGGTFGSYTITSTSTTWWIPNLPNAGHWTWVVSGASTASYSTTCWIGCGFSNPACDSTIGTRLVRYPWGDNFAGRLANSSAVHEYEMSLEEGQIVSVSVSDTGQPCNAQVSVYAPGDQTHFTGQSVLTWTDGAAVSEPSGSTRGVGGSIQAITDGTYKFTVSTASSASCGFYRIHFATTGMLRHGQPMPAW